MKELFYTQTVLLVEIRSSIREITWTVVQTYNNSIFRIATKRQSTRILNIEHPIQMRAHGIQPKFSMLSRTVTTRTLNNVV